MLPTYDELPVRAGAPKGSSWGLWGDGDRLGCLNLLTPERVRAGVAAVVDGATFALDLPLDQPSPPLFGRAAFRHEVAWLDRRGGHDDSLHDFNTQSSSQWDGFRHIRHPVHDFYGGVADEDHGTDVWVRHGIAGRAVLCDVDGWRTSVGRPLDHSTNDPIEPDDVAAALTAQGVAVETGDVLLLHTGWSGWYRSLTAAQKQALAAPGALRSPGLRSGVATARYLWDLHIAAVAADNPALEVWPPGSLLTEQQIAAAREDVDLLPERFLHFALLPLLGLPIGELWDLTALTEACRADGRWTCLLTSSPLHITGGVASPPNAMAIR